MSEIPWNGTAESLRRTSEKPLLEWRSNPLLEGTQEFAWGSVMTDDALGSGISLIDLSAFRRLCPAPPVGARTPEPAHRLVWALFPVERHLPDLPLRDGVG